MAKKRSRRANGVDYLNNQYLAIDPRQGFRNEKTGEERWGAKIINLASVAEPSKAITMVVEPSRAIPVEEITKQVSLLEGTVDTKFCAPSFGSISDGNIRYDAPDDKIAFNTAPVCTKTKKDALAVQKLRKDLGTDR